MGRLSLRVDQQVMAISGYQTELARWDKERQEWQATAAENSTAIRQDIDSFRHRLERQDSSIHSVQRTTDRVIGELGRVQETCDALRDHVELRLNQQTRLVNTSKTDMEVKLVDLEIRINKLGDDLWGEETGMSKVVYDLATTNEAVNTVATELKSMRLDKANVRQLQAVQEEVNRFMQDANSNVSTLRETVDRMLSDMKAHFKTATNTVAAHNASMLQEVRSSYQKELSEVGKLRDLVQGFMADERMMTERLQQSLMQSQQSTEVMVQKVVADFEDFSKSRRRDRNSGETELKSVLEQLAALKQSSTTLATSMEHLGSVIWMVVQSERASSALDVQDHADRARVALVGFKDPVSAPGVAKVSAKGKKDGERPTSSDQPGIGPNGGVINLDQRCLSCSGNGQTVLSGFKMACLQYMPGPVTFARKTYDRGDLLNARERLLDQAHEALQHGPGSNVPRDTLGSSFRDSGSASVQAGSLAAIAVASITGMEQSEMRPHSRSSSSSGPCGVGLRMPPLSSRGSLATVR